MRPLKVNGRITRRQLEDLLREYFAGYMRQLHGGLTARTGTVTMGTSSRYVTINDRALEYNRVQSVLNSAFRDLDVDQKLILMALYGVGYTQKEAAEMLRCTRRWVVMTRDKALGQIWAYINQRLA